MKHNSPNRRVLFLPVVKQVQDFFIKNNTPRNIMLVLYTGTASDAAMQEALENRAKNFVARNKWKKVA